MSKPMDMTGYTKLFGSIIASTIWGEPNNVRIVWITMLALANKDGIVEGSVPGLAQLSRVTVQECRDAVQALQQPDPDSRTKDHEGRRIAPADGGWLILNHAKYRAKMGVDERREYLRLKQQEHRAKNSVNSRSDSSTMSTHAESDSPAYSDADQKHKAESASLGRSYDLVLSPEGGESVKNKAKGTKEQCAAYAVEIGLPSTDGEVFFDGQEGKGWKGTKDWRAVMRTWKGHGYMASQKQHIPSTKGQQTAQWEPPSGV